MPSLRLWLFMSGMVALPALGAAAGQSGQRINVHDYKDAASLRQALQRAAMQARFHVPPLREPNAKPPQGAPSIISGKVLTGRLLTASIPGVPRAQVTFDAPNRLSSLGLVFTYPTGQFQMSSYSPASPGEKSGTTLIEEGQPSWGVYAASGEWTLTSAYITDEQGIQTYYTGDRLAALFPQLKLTVLNTISPDNTPPTVTAGEILTPVVHAARPNPVFKVKMSVADDLSGVATIVLFIRDPSGTIYVSEDTYPASPVKNGTLLVKNDFFGSPSPGTWTIYSYQVCDVPNNCVMVDNPADIGKLFGSNTFTVVH